MLRYFKVLLVSFLTLTLAAPLLRGQEVGSHARIVRISYLEGTVQLNGERGTMNSPIREGIVLRTDSDGLAEVQFEDSSAIRMASETQVTFAQLARLTSGEPITRVDLDDGEAEFLVPASSAGKFAVNVGSKNVLFKQPGRYRILSTNASPLEIAVWKGVAIVRDRESGREVSVKMNETFTLNPSDPGQYDLEDALVADDLDQWSNMRDQTLYAASSVATTYTSPNVSSNSLFSPSPLYYGGAYCSPWGSGWGWQPLGLYGDCWNSAFSGFGGFYQPFYYFPPTSIIIVPTPIGIPHRPPHLRPPTVPTVVVAASERGPGAVPVKPGVHTFRFDHGLQRVFNEDNFQRTVPHVENPVSGEVVRQNSHAVEPVVAPGHRSPGNGPTATFTPAVTVAPPPSVPRAATPATPPSSRPSAPAPPPHSYSPPASTGSHGFSGGSMPSHSSSSSSPSHSSGGHH
jgi:hypothetical protein